MPVRLAAFVIAGFLFLSIGTAVEAHALTNAVDVVVLVDRTDGQYEFGEIVNVTALVFDRGALVDPSAVAASVNRFPVFSALNITRQSVGVFTGAFVFESHPSGVIVNATVDGTADTGTAVVFHRLLPRVQLVPSVGIAAPGQTVSVEVDVSDPNGPHDADSLNVTVDLSFAPGFASVTGSTPLNSTHVGIGRYLTSYTVPSNLDLDAILEFRAFVAMGPSATFAP